jgi:hypothetical protein
LLFPFILSRNDWTCQWVTHILCTWSEDRSREQHGTGEAVGLSMLEETTTHYNFCTNIYCCYNEYMDQLQFAATSLVVA